MRISPKRLNTPYIFVVYFRSGSGIFSVHHYFALKTGLDGENIEALRERLSKTREKQKVDISGTRKGH